MESDIWDDDKYEPPTEMWNRKRCGVCNDPRPHETPKKEFTVGQQVSIINRGTIIGATVTSVFPDGEHYSVRWHDGWTNESGPYNCWHANFFSF